jgi:acetyl-CoA carboxylase carboxyltransferase component
VRDAEKSGRTLSPEEVQSLRDTIRQQYQDQTDIRYGAARGWVDAIIPPDATRTWLGAALMLADSKYPSVSPSQGREV